MAESLKTGFHHVALRVPNFDEALAFYTEALGLTVRARWEGAALLQLSDGGHLELFAGTEPVPQTHNGYYHMAYRVEDVDGALARAAQYGAPTTIPALAIWISAAASARVPGGRALNFSRSCNVSAALRCKGPAVRFWLLGLSYFCIRRSCAPAQKRPRRLGRGAVWTYVCLPGLWGATRRARNPAPPARAPAEGSEASGSP